MKSYLGNIPNAHIRDFQRKRVYDAEASCTFWNMFTPLSLCETQTIIDSISNWAKIPIPTLDIHGQENLPLAYATATEIVLPTHATRTLPFICHEMAHVINYNSDNADHHGQYFVTTYLQLVKTFIGHNEFLELQQVFKNNKVKYLTTALI